MYDIAELFYGCLFQRNFWCYLPEDGEIIASKHVGVMQKVLTISY